MFLTNRVTGPILSYPLPEIKRLQIDFGLTPSRQAVYLLLKSADEWLLNAGSLFDD